MTSDSSMDQL